MVSNGLYSVSYINILSTSPPNSVMSNSTTIDICNNQCDIQPTCAGYTFKITDTYACPSEITDINDPLCKKNERENI